jgi:hypothetical protein
LDIIATKFNEYFTGVGPQLAKKITEIPGKSFRHYLKKSITSRFSFNQINESDTRKIINSLKNKSSVGIDGISTTLLKSIAPAIIHPLTLIINQSLYTGIFPDKLKIAKVIPLYKKGPNNVLDNYRPISLLTALSKVFEKVVFHQLHSYFQTNALFFQSQYGFRPNHSTELAALEFCDLIINEIENKKFPLSIFLDLSKAFDTIDHSILLEKLNFYGIGNTESNWFKSYLCERKQLVEINNARSPLLNITTGVPQGSILGPLLFIIYINDIYQASTKFRFIMYADDTTLTTSIPYTAVSLNSYSLLINRELEKIRVWLSVNKLSLNASKTKFMVFRTKNKHINYEQFDLKIDDCKIERQSEFNFLGLLFDEYLCWRSHINKISNKISKFVGILNRLKRYLPPFILKTLYCSMIQSHLMYGILVWGANSSRLVKIQKKSVRIMCNAKYNAHTDPLFRLTKIVKITDLYRVAGLSLYFRSLKNNLPTYFHSFADLATHADIHNYTTRFNHTLVTPRTRTTLARNYIRNRIPQLVNDIPPCILDKIHSHCQKSFLSHVKNYYINSYNNSCNILNCYVCGHP